MLKLKQTGRYQRWLWFIVGMMALASWPTPVSYADTGPKPEMTFEFVYETAAPLTIIAGQQMQCDLSDCRDAQPLEEAGPQRFYCTETDCQSLAYGYTTYNQLVIEFSDGVTRTSNVFERETFNNIYRVNVFADRLEIERTGGTVSSIFERYPNLQLLVALLVLIIFMVLVLRGISWARRRRGA